MEFYTLTYIEYHHVAKHHMLADEREWQRIRWQTTHLINLQIDKSNKIQPEDLLKLPSDEILIDKAPLPTKEEMLALAEKYRKGITG